MGIIGCVSKLLVEWRIEADGHCHIYVNGVPFGDPLACVADGFHCHDIYHFIFECHLGWSHVVEHFLCGEILSDRLLLQEEAVVLNQFMPARSGVEADCRWVHAMLDFGQGFELTEIERVMELCREEFRSLQAEIDRNLYAKREYDIKNRRTHDMKEWAKRYQSDKEGG